MIAPPIIEVPLEPTTFRFCCTGGGTIERYVALRAGRYLLRVGQKATGCSEAVIPFVTSSTDERISTGVAFTAAWATTLVDVPHDQRARLRVFVEGGLRCCGTTTIDKIELVRL
ncbi:MAG: hypothetical protein ACKV2T_39180 [Kofleriaceae bacterium]